MHPTSLKFTWLHILLFHKRLLISLQVAKPNLMIYRLSGNPVSLKLCDMPLNLLQLHEFNGHKFNGLLYDCKDDNVYKNFKCI